MSLLKVIEDKGAVVSWSPIADKPNLVALGTKVIIERINNISCLLRKEN